MKDVKEIIDKMKSSNNKEEVKELKKEAMFLKTNKTIQK